MMSLSTVKLNEIVRKQYLFKLRAYIDTLSSLMGIQVIAMLFSFGGNFSTSSFSSALQIELRYLSSDLVIIFTMIWAFTTAITITTKPYRNQDFTYITNRLSSSLSNILFLMTASFAGAFTAILSRFFIMIVAYFVEDGELYIVSQHIGDFFLGITSSFLYIFLITALGYFIGTLVQMNKLFTIIIPVVFIGILFVDASYQSEPVIGKIFKFYVFESSLFLFSLKVIVTAIGLFALSISILNRMEVRK